MLKKLIKKYAESRKVKVLSIEHVRINVDNYYPAIRLMYRLNGEEFELDVVQMYRQAREKDHSSRLVLKKLFAGQF